MSRYIKLQGKSYSYDWLNDKAQGGAQATLKRAKETGASVICTCTSKNPTLQIHYLKSSDIYYLHRSRDSYADHSESCPLSEPTKSKQSLLKHPAIKSTADGTSIKLNISLYPRIGDNERDEVNSAFPRQANVPGRNTITLLGLLEHIWTEAGLHEWHPNFEGKRDWKSIAYRVERYFKEENVKISGKLVENLIFIPFSQRARLTPSRSLVIGQIEKATKAGNGNFRIKLQNVESQVLWINGHKSRMFEQSFGTMLNNIGKPNCRLIMIASTAHTGDNISINAIAVMNASNDFIPVDSSYELTIASKLVAEKRIFSKPLKYSADESEVFPDFLMLDAGQVLPMEVFGMTSNEEYSARKIVKTEYYDRKYGPGNWWYWDVPAHKEPPAFPKPGIEASI